MAGELVPLVLLPRFTTIAGLISGEYFTTAAIDVTPYETAVVTVWRGLVVGTNPPGQGAPPALPAFKIWFEEATDQVTWSICGGSPNGGDPGTVSSTPNYHYEPGQKQYVLVLNKRWYRLKVQLYDATNSASCYAVGFLERRVP